MATARDVRVAGSRGEVWTRSRSCAIVFDGAERRSDPRSLRTIRAMSLRILRCVTIRGEEAPAHRSIVLCRPSP
jgi:hypothetical protein